MGYWKTKERCYVLGIELMPGIILSLSEENEKELKIGKFQERRIDEKTKKETRVGYAHLSPATREEIARIEENEPQAQADGFVVYPPAVRNDSLDPNKPFRLLRAGAAA